MATSLPIVVAIVSAFAGLITWIAQKDRERRDSARQKKLDLYETLLTCVIHLTAQDATPFFVESQQAWLFASDDVLAQINAYTKALASGNADNKQLNDILGKLLLSMRLDLGLKTEINEDWVKSNFRAVTAPPEQLQKYLESKRSDK